MTKKCIICKHTVWAIKSSLESTFYTVAGAAVSYSQLESAIARLAHPPAFGACLKTNQMKIVGRKLIDKDYLETGRLLDVLVEYYRICNFAFKQIWFLLAPEIQID